MNIHSEFWLNPETLKAWLEYVKQLNEAVEEDTVIDTTDDFS